MTERPSLFNDPMTQGAMVFWAMPLKAEDVDEDRFHRNLPAKNSLNIIDASGFRIGELGALVIAALLSHHRWIMVVNSRYARGALDSGYV